MSTSKKGQKFFEYRVDGTVESDDYFADQVVQNESDNHLECADPLELLLLEEAYPEYIDIDDMFSNNH